MESRSFETLLTEYSQLREDERQYVASSLTLITIVISVVTAVTAAFVISNTPRSSVPTVVFLLAPTLPLGVFGFVAAHALDASYRIDYLRAIEVELFSRDRLEADGWPVPSYTHGVYALFWSGPTKFLWNIVDGAGLTVFGALVVGPIVLVSGTWFKVGMSVVYGGAALLIVSMYATAYMHSGVPSWVKQRVRDELLPQRDSVGNRGS